MSQSGTWLAGYSHEPIERSGAEPATLARPRNIEAIRRWQRQEVAWLACLLISLAVPAEAQDSSWSARVAAGPAFGDVTPSSRTHPPTLGVAGNGVGAIAVTATLTAGLEAEVTAFVLGRTASLAPRKSTAFNVSGITIAANAHFPLGSELVALVGPMFGALGRHTSSELEVSSDWGVGVQAGLRWVRFEDRTGWSADTRFCWLQIHQRVANRNPLPLPRFVTLGASYRF